MATVGEFTGQEINLYLKDATSTGDYLLVGCATTSDYSEDREMIEARCKQSSDWTTKRPGTASWEISTDGLVKFENDVNPQVMHDWFNNKTLLDAKFSTDVPGDTEISGQGYITSLSISGAVDEIVTYSFTFMGTGEPTFATII